MDSPSILSSYYLIDPNVVRAEEICLCKLWSLYVQIGTIRPSRDRKLPEFQPKYYVRSHFPFPQTNKVEK